MNFIKSLSCFGGSLSSTADQSRSERRSGTAMNRNVFIHKRKKPSPLLRLPEELQSKICTYLQAHDIAKLAQVNSHINITIKNADLIAKAWYRQFALSHQTLLKTPLTSKDKNQLEGWLRRFTKDEALIKSIMDRQESKYFPVLFVSTVTKLMSECETFKLETKATFPAFGKSDLFKFSPDGHHVIIPIDKGKVKIYGKKDGGSWEEKITISHDDWVRSVTFSANSRHVVTTSDDKTAKIYDLSTDGSWVEKATISHVKSIFEATFSPADRYIVTASKDGKAKIYGKQDDGSWVEKAIISHDDFENSAEFSADGLYVVAIEHRRAIIYGKQDDGSWVKKAIISHYKPVRSAKFSADSRHLVTCSNDGTVAICGKKDDGSWRIEIILTVHEDNTAKITELRMNE
ncbi:F-box/WD repeat-containing protein [Endozoicomonas sp. ALD040]|uniref:F-box/WD repeat-containing protein n=1 Tax=Endozoicomonas sp. ALD040 TaxID=3403079 RepID=UPI003BB0E038